MIIRKAIPSDAERIVAFLLLATEEIVYKFIGEKDHEKAKAFLLYFIKKENNQYSYQNCLVAEIDNEMVAAVAFYDGARLAALRQPIIDYIRDNFNKTFEPEDETSNGEFYIDSIGVSLSHRGKGIGANLLQFLIDEYVSKKRKNLGLLVDEENPKAKKLYLKLGFKSVGKIVLVGKQMEHLQIKGGE
ncbi:MAG TPA: GNAT family N-acetyltransferase [Bacteroidales bacterium]|nr:GNAT family N-acetyltransferase [Bacteroidales bacterium]